MKGCCVSFSHLRNLRVWLGPGKVVLHLSFAVPALLLLDHLLVALQHNLFHLVKEDSLSVSGEHGVGNYSIQYGFLRAPRDLVEVAIDKHLRELLLVPGLKVVPNILRGDEVGSLHLGLHHACNAGASSQKQSVLVHGMRTVLRNLQGVSTAWGGPGG